MPELPEVENIALGLAEVIPGKTVKKVNLRRSDILCAPQGSEVSIDVIIGKKVQSVSRRAKRLIISFSSGPALLVQLGMTGRFVITDPKAELEKHAHLIIDLSGNIQLRFIDHRRFGRVWVYPTLDSSKPDPQMISAGMGKLGPEPFDISPKQFKDILQSQRVIKNLLLDQTRIAGLGNIYADESLFDSGIYPETVASEISEMQADDLIKSIRKILKKAIRAGGTSFSDYRNAYGDMGNFVKRLKVYQRTGLPCRVCGTEIKKIVISNRSTHFCPKCQPK